jgi:hypothetical protein
MGRLRAPKEQGMMSREGVQPPLTAGSGGNISAETYDSKGVPLDFLLILPVLSSLTVR